MAKKLKNKQCPYCGEVGKCILVNDSDDYLCKACGSSGNLQEDNADDYYDELFCNTPEEERGEAYDGFY